MIHDPNAETSEVDLRRVQEQLERIAARSRKDEARERLYDPLTATRPISTLAVRHPHRRPRRPRRVSFEAGVLLLASAVLVGGGTIWRMSGHEESVRAEPAPVPKASPSPEGDTGILGAPVLGPDRQLPSPSASTPATVVSTPAPSPTAEETPLLVLAAVPTPSPSASAPQVASTPPEPSTAPSSPPAVPSASPEPSPSPVPSPSASASPSAQESPSSSPSPSVTPSGSPSPEVPMEVPSPTISLDLLGLAIRIPLGL